MTIQATFRMWIAVKRYRNHGMYGYLLHSLFYKTEKEKKKTHTAKNAVNVCMYVLCLLNNYLYSAESKRSPRNTDY
jgi:hypothetical protein